MALPERRQDATVAHAGGIVDTRTNATHLQNLLNAKHALWGNTVLVMRQIAKPTAKHLENTSQLKEITANGVRLDDTKTKKVLPGIEMNVKHVFWEPTTTKKVLRFARPTVSRLVNTSQPTKIHA